MAIIIKNAARIRMLNGYRLLIAKGADWISLRNASNDSFIEWTPGLKELLEEPDGGKLVDPLNGDERPTQIKIKMFYTSALDADQLEQLLVAVDKSTPDGLRRQHNMVLEIPDFEGATAGKRVRFTKTVVASGGLRIRSGTKFDEIEADLMDFNATPTVERYTTPLS